MKCSVTKPAFELFNPFESYLNRLEKAARTCYKSEKNTKKEKTETFLTKIINSFGHYSVAEHESCIIKIKGGLSELEYSRIIEAVPLFAFRIDKKTKEKNDSRYLFYSLISGNIRMWKELEEKDEELFSLLFGYCIQEVFPLFFDKKYYKRVLDDTQIVDSNPFTNKNNLTKEEMLKHTTLTGKFTGSRSMSHQLVRHRLAAYSQESQRYCNYGKKGFQIIVPSSLEGTEPEKELLRGIFVGSCIEACSRYLFFIQKLLPEDARELLPNAIKTEVVATYTLKMWKHLIEHRGHNLKAQAQIRELCLEAEKQINQRLSFAICD